MQIDVNVDPNNSYCLNQAICISLRLETENTPDG